MRLALGVLFLWLGAAFLYLGSHGLQASTPWGAYQTIIAKMREGADDDADAEASTV